MEASERSHGVAVDRCPFCHDRVTMEEPDWGACAGCLARNHLSCWGEHGRCAACGAEALLTPATRPRRRRRRWWLSASLAVGLLGVPWSLGLGDTAPLQADSLARIPPAIERELLECEGQLEVVPVPPDAHVAVARGLERTLGIGDHRGALADFDRALEIHPRYVEALRRRAHAHTSLGDTEAAVRDYTLALEIHPQATTLRFLRGVALNQLGRHQAALADLSLAVEALPTHRDALYHRGLAALRSGQAEQAVADFERLLSRLPPAPSSSSTDYAGQRGALYQRLLAEAKATLESQAAEQP